MMVYFLVFAVTASAAGFKKLSGDVWQDPVTGLHWSDRLDGRFDRESAKNACVAFTSGGETFRLPTADEFSALEKNGGRVVLPHMKDHFYWSATAHPTSPNVRHVFNGNTGSLFWVMY